MLQDWTREAAVDCLAGLEMAIRPAGVFQSGLNVIDPAAPAVLDLDPGYALDHIVLANAVPTRQLGRVLARTGSNCTLVHLVAGGVLVSSNQGGSAEGYSCFGWNGRMQVWYNSMEDSKGDRETAAGRNRKLSVAVAIAVDALAD
jgi:hypothetical protein